MKPVNPRVLCFLAAHGLTESTIQRIDGEVPHLTIEGSSMPWTLHFVLWNSAQWRAWAAELGFTRGSEPHRDALRAGHTEDAYDEWLHLRCGVTWSASSPPR